MATLVLAAAGAAVGGGLGGSILGLSGLAIGKAVGATLGSVIDQKLMGAGSAPVETGRIERFRIMGSTEGAGLPRVFGRFRIAGQIVWSSRFRERVKKHSGGGKGGSGPTVREYSYSISFAIALCEGEVTRVGRIWADGQPISQKGLNWRLHHGSEDQMPDPLISAIEGAEVAPAYRGTAYVVFENLDLTPFGNRIPQFNFEVFRRVETTDLDLPRPPALDIRGVALVPGTGEYALATRPVHLGGGKGNQRTVNVNNDRGVPDLIASIEQLREELPACRATSLVVSWFGDDLRCDRCQLYPAVEQTARDASVMPWVVSGINRANARTVSISEDRPVFGGTPTDASVVQAIRRLTAMGQSVMFYPFILMDIQTGNGLNDPWNPGTEQPVIPWRGRITLSVAAGAEGTPDKSAAAADEVAEFFGRARPSHFRIVNGEVAYSGPNEWSYRRFILHYASLCKLAGGVGSFCIGSEMRSLTQIRDSADGYPAVRELCSLAADVRSILGPNVKIGYAADWSEYFGHQPADGSGDVIFHLDELWAHTAIDFVGIDNYMPLSDWRDGSGHRDAAAGSIYNIEYLKSNVAGGEGFDWYYPDATARSIQDRHPIQDGAYGEDWVFRFKDLNNWWARPHYNRISGERSSNPTAWLPKSKPIWFTELGCPAVDKGTNQPNVFFDPKSSESELPYFSDGSRDDFMQHRYLQAMFAFWGDAENNPASDLYGGSMVDLENAFVWAWDARPWPDFPARLGTWIDGTNYGRGHWLNGRIGSPALAEVAGDICLAAGLHETSLKELGGLVTGYSVGGVESGRQSLQPLMLAYGFDATSSGGSIAFIERNAKVAIALTSDEVALSDSDEGISKSRTPDFESADRVQFGFVDADSEYQTAMAEASVPDESNGSVSQTSLSIVFTEAEGKSIVQRWMGEARIGRDSVEFSLPPSRLRVSPADVLALRSPDGVKLYRIDRTDEAGIRDLKATRIEAEVYKRPAFLIGDASFREVVSEGPVYAEFIDLPLLSGAEIPYAPHIAVTRSPWTGPIGVYSSSADYDYGLLSEVFSPAVVGQTLDPLPQGTPSLWMRKGIRVRVDSGMLSSASEQDVLNGANVAAVRFGGEGDWEVLQFSKAQLVAPRTYLLENLLRGQAGTDAVMPAVWPVGSDFVLIDSSVTQLPVTPSSRGLARHYRVGPASLPYDDASFFHTLATFDGVGLRPYRPVHLVAKRRADGGVGLSWVRRTRLDGDSWSGVDVPVGEDRLLFDVRVLADHALLRRVDVHTTSYVYTAADQGVDGWPQNLMFEVAQVSERFGPGPYGRIEFT
jgi:hypothetical protein